MSEVLKGKEVEIMCKKKMIIIIKQSSLANTPADSYSFKRNEILGR